MGDPGRMGNPGKQVRLPVSRFVSDIGSTYVNTCVNIRLSVCVCVCVRAGFTRDER